MYNIKKNLLFLILLIALGVGSLVYQVFNGLSVTGLREPVVWGLYVVNFTFCMGIGAGILMLLSFMSNQKKIKDEFKLLLSLSSFAILSLAGIFIILDLGRIDRFYYMLIYPHPESPLFWDFIALNFFLAVSFIFCFTTARQLFVKKGLSENASLIEAFTYKIVNIKKEFNLSDILFKKARFVIFLLVAVFYLITTDLFVSLKAHPEWNSLLVSFSFLVSAILSGISIVMIFDSFFKKTIFVNDNNILFDAIKKFLLFFLIISSVTTIAKYIMDTNNPLLSQRQSLFPFSNIILLIGGNILPILLMFIYKNRRSITSQLVPVLILSGILLKRAEFIISAYYRRWLPFASNVSYNPTITELLIVLGMYSTFIMVMMFIFHIVCVKEIDKS